MSTIRFNLRTDKILKTGRSPIELIYQISGQRKYYSTEQKLLSQCWDPKTQQSIYIDKRTAKKLHPAINYDLFLTEKEAKKVNNKLDELKKDIEAIEKRFEMDKVVYSAEMVIDKLKADKFPTTKKEAHSNHLFDFIDRYIDEHKNTCRVTR